MYYLFWFAVLMLFYIYVGYPVILYVMTRYKIMDYEKDYFLPTVSIIISAYNEEKNIGNKIQNLLELDYPEELIEIIIVSDGSDDETHNIVRSFNGITLIESKGRQGKAMCVNQAVHVANNDVLIMMDARQNIDSRAVKELVANFYDKSIGAVSGELILLENTADTMTSHNAGFYWKYEKFIRKSESILDSVQGVTGALYAIRKNLMPELPPGTILDDVYVPMHVIKSGSRVLFDPSALVYDKVSMDESVERKRKIRTIAGNYQLISMSSWLLNPFKYRTFFQFLSHKVLRLISPFLMMLYFFSSLMIVISDVVSLYTLLFVISVILVGMSFININMGSKMKKVLKIVSAFLQLNYYAFLGFIEYYKNKNLYLWK